MSNHSQGGDAPRSPSKLDSDDNRMLGNSPSKNEYLRKLTDGLDKRNMRSRSHLSVVQFAPALEEAKGNNHSGVAMSPGFRGAANNARKATTNSAYVRQSSQHKQSVLVKRVYRDERVVSGLENAGQRSELIDEDQGTLGSQAGSVKDLAARESNIVNYEPNNGNDSRMQSTMYITGKAQRFAMKPNKAQANNNNAQMIINLGDKTQVGFNYDNDGNMLVGVTDIETGASRVQHPSGKNFKTTLKPKQTFRDRSGSLKSNEGSRSNIRDNSHMREVSAQFVASPLELTATPALSGVHIETQRQSPRKEFDPMMISSLSPGIKAAHSPSHLKRGGEKSPEETTKQHRQQPIVQIQVQESPKRYKPPQMTNVSVKNVDVRSMIPNQFTTQKDAAAQQKSPSTIRGMRMSPSHDNKQQTTNNKNANKAAQDIKTFHQQQAQQYKDYVKKSIGVPKYHDQSQSTLMDAIITDDDRVDRSADHIGPTQVNQGTQPSDIMMQSLEGQLQQLRATTNTNQSFFEAANLVNEIKLLETVRSDNSGPNMLSQHGASVTTKKLVTAEASGNDAFKLMDQNNVTINSKMLSTYRGNDNMKLKIIDHSVLRDHTNNSPSTTSPMRQQLVDKLSSPLGDHDQGSKAQESLGTHISIPSFDMQQQYQLQQQQPYHGRRQPYIHQPSAMERDIINRASPMSKIESFRALLRQESMQNELRIVNNQDNFKNLINPEVTKREFKILSASPSKQQFHIGYSHNQQLLTKKDNMLHTVTDEFLQDKYPTTATGRKPVKARIAVDPKEFRAKLQKKIEELRQLEISESVIFNELLQTREIAGSESSVPFGMGRQRFNSAAAEEEHNTLFMTYLQHGGTEQQRNIGSSEAAETGQDLKEAGTRTLTLRQNSLEAKHASQNLPMISPQLSHMHQKHATLGPVDAKKVLVQLTNEDARDDIDDDNQSRLPRMPIAMSAILPSSFADMTQYLNPEQLKSGVTLATSGSANTLKRISKRYTREQRIVIFEDGQSISAATPCFQIELNEMLRKFNLRQNGPSLHTTNQQDINDQLKLYERAIRQILDQCGSRLYLDNELTPEDITRLDGAAPKRFTALYTVLGEKLDSLINIDEDTCMLVAGYKGKFTGLKTEQLFGNGEAAQDMFNRIIGQSPIRFDRKSLNKTLTSSPSSIRRGKTIKDSPSKTFQLTEMSQVIEDPMISPAKSSRNRNYGSQTTREIIKASKAEMLERLTKKRDMGLKGQLNHNSAASSTMRSKRLAQITMVTKGIKRGKLPPIKSPKQLDVFVFGEKDSVRLLRKNDLITSTSLMQQKTTHNVNIKEADTSSLINNQAGEQLNRQQERRGTYFQLPTGQSLLNSIKQDVSITTTTNEIQQISSMSVIQAAQQEVISDVQMQEALSVDLQKQLENVHSIQLIKANRNASAATHKTDKLQERRATESKEIVSDANIKVAKRALRDRSPSYLNQKLVSQTSLQDNSNAANKLKVKYKLSKKEKDKIKGEVNEHVLQNALKQRSEWRQKHKLDDKQLYKLFSEFSSMMQIHRTQENEADPNSFKSRVTKLNKQIGIEEDPLSNLFPMNSNISSLKYNKMQKEDDHNSHRLKKNDYRDFQVPIQVCIDYSEVLRPTKVLLRRTVLNALGVSSNHDGAKMSYDQFLRLNSFVRYNQGNDEDYIWFCVRLFDPQLSGFASIEECETVIDLLFDNQDEEGNTTKPPKVDIPSRQAVKSQESPESYSKSSVGGVEADEQSISDMEGIESKEKLDSIKEEVGGEEVTSQVSIAKAKKKSSILKQEEESKDESVASNIKKVCHDKNIFKATGFMDPEALAQAFKDGLFDVEDFKSALK